MNCLTYIYKRFLDILYYITNGYTSVRYIVCPVCNTKFHRWCSMDNINNITVCSTGCAYMY